MPFCLKCGKHITGEDFYCAPCFERKEQGEKKAGRERKENLGAWGKKILVLLLPLVIFFLYLGLFHAGPEKPDPAAPIMTLRVPEEYTTIQGAIDAVEKSKTKGRVRESASAPDQNDAAAETGATHETAGITETTETAGITEITETAGITETTETPASREGVIVSEPEAVIVVAPGLYRENINFKGKNIVLQSSEPDNPDVIAATIIHGSGRGSTVTFQGGEEKSAVLRGFTITGGSGSMEVFAYGPEWGRLEGFSGGGIAVMGGSSPTIVGNVIRDNYSGESAEEARGAGGGIFVIDSFPTIMNNTITGNKAGRGGGIYAFMSAPHIEGNTVVGNRAAWQGGGIYLGGELLGLIAGCIIKENKADDGGGIYAIGTSISISHSEILENEAAYSGGGMMFSNSTPFIHSSSIRGNLAGESGGGIAMQSSRARITGSTMEKNEAGWRGGGGISAALGSSLFLAENIFRLNTAIEGEDILTSDDSSLEHPQPDDNVFD